MRDDIVRKWVSLAGGVLVAAGVLLWNGHILFGGMIPSAVWMLSLAAGVVALVGGLAAVALSKCWEVELLERVDVLDEMDGWLVAAAALVFIVGWWMVLVGVGALTEYFLWDVVGMDTGLVEHPFQSAIRSVTNVVRALSVITIGVGVVDVAAGVCVLRRRHPGFVLASLTASVVMSVVLGRYTYAVIVAWYGGVVDISFMPPLVASRIAFPVVVVSIVAVCLIIWRYQSERMALR